MLSILNTLILMMMRNITYLIDNHYNYCSSMINKLVNNERLFFLIVIFSSYVQIIKNRFPTYGKRANIKYMKIIRGKIKAKVTPYHVINYDKTKIDITPDLPCVRIVKTSRIAV
uniref:Uncharacterized protein n=1 Tax=Heterorhabditis bacteriophora TaxID=37862 RepID=A0A1I7WUR2_HETBA